MRNHKNFNSNSGSAMMVTIMVCTVALVSTVLVSVSDAGIGRYGISGGRITRFASIFVNDREFDISTAAIFIDGAPATESSLRLGHTVLVAGDHDDELPVGSAERVHVDNPVQGQIGNIDDEEDEMVVLDHVIVMDPETLFERLSGESRFEDFSPGDFVNVSGFPTTGGGFLATRIEQVLTGSESRVIGAVANLSGTTFDINDLTVDFGAIAPSGFPMGIVSDGDNVRVRGDLNVAGALVATAVEFLPGEIVVLEDIGEFEGLITSFESPMSFLVGNIPVTTDESTGFVGGGAANLTTDTNVIVRGQFDGFGSLNANEITIRGTRIRVSGNVDAVSEPSLTVLGVPILATAVTEMKDDSDADADPFTVGNLSPGDYVETRSLTNPPATTPVIAARIERDDPEESVLLQGFVGSTGTQSFEVFGVSVHVTGGTDYTDANDDPISAQDFFDAISVGTFVKIKGTSPANQTVVATDITLKLDN